MYNNIKISKEENEIRLNMFNYIQSKKSKKIYISEISQKFKLSPRKAYQFLITFCNIGILKRVNSLRGTIEFHVNEVII